MGEGGAEAHVSASPGLQVTGSSRGHSGLASQPVTTAGSRVKQPQAGKNGPLALALLATTEPNDPGQKALEEQLSDGFSHEVKGTPNLDSALTLS